MIYAKIVIIAENKVYQEGVTILMNEFTVASSLDFSEVCKVLEKEYNRPNPLVPPLGNVLDPLDELVYILLTTMTEYGSYEVFKKLKERYKTWDEVLYSSQDEFFNFLKPIGLVNQRGARIIAIFNEINNKFKALTLTPLYNMDDKAVEDFLVSLPGMGKKTARCVMMYSLNRRVFPVDTHVLRLCRRLNLINPKILWQKAHDLLQEAILPEERYSLHVNLVLHGKKICKAKMPKCLMCVLYDYCPSMLEWETLVDL